MLTGRPPVGRFGLPSHVNHDVPPELDPVVLTCLKTDPADRYPAVAAVLEDVARLEDRLGLGVTHELQAFSRSTTNLLGTARTMAGSRVIQMAAAAVLVLALAGGYVWLRSRASVSPPGPRETSSAAAVQARPPTAPRTTTDSGSTDLQQARDQVTAERYAPALATLGSIIKDHPTSPSAVDAYLLTAEVQVATGHPEEAIGTYAEIRARFPRDRRAAEAGFHLGDLLNASGDPARQDQALQVFHEVADAFSEVPWSPRALAAAAAIEQARGLVQEDPALGAQVPTAISTLRQMTESYPNVPEAEKALWDLGNLYEESGQYGRAAHAFVDLGTHFPETQYDAWWRAGQLYDRPLNQPAQALGAYRRVPPRSPHAADAQARIGQLSQ
jgi:TolA-binding protein